MSTEWKIVPGELLTNYLTQIMLHMNIKLDLQLIIYYKPLCFER